MLVYAVGTFGVQSFNITDSPEDTVIFRCLFSLFSSDNGCTVQLLLSNVVQYEANFSRNGDTAIGTIPNIATGEYQVKVFDQGSSEVIFTTTLNVTGEPPIKVTSTTSYMHVASGTVSNPPDIPSTSFITTTTTSECKFTKDFV